jgi:radical SAM superfamily enzyme YgiQ (UPF0313 family)
LKLLLIAHGLKTQPFGLIDIYNYLLAKDYQVSFLHIYNDYRKLNTIKDVPEYIGITSNTLMSTATGVLIGYLKKKWPRSKIILGGRHFCNDILEVEKDQLLSKADYVVLGEGEYAIERIINGSVKDKIVYGTKLTERDFHNIKLPDELIMKYQVGVIKNAVLFSRGCVFNCVFCCDRRVPVLRKEPDVCARHVKNLIGWLGNYNITIYDDIFSLNKKWLTAFRDEMKKQKVKAKLSCFIHGKNLTEEMIDLLIECGVVHMSLGAESGDNRILKLVNKNCTVEDYWAINEIVKRKKVVLHTLWMIGNIGETKETIQKTIKLSKKIGTDSPYFSYAIPFPGTLFWKKVPEYGKIIEHRFEKWDNKTIVFVPNGLTEKGMRIK